MVSFEHLTEIGDPLAWTAETILFMLRTLPQSWRPERTPLWSPQMWLSDEAKPTPTWALSTLENLECFSVQVFASAQVDLVSGEAARQASEPGADLVDIFIFVDLWAQEFSCKHASPSIY